MDSFTINMKNQTQAYKARAMLINNGMRCIVERTHKPRAGCTFALRVFGEKGRACALLETAGVRCDLP